MWMDFNGYGRFEPPTSEMGAGSPAALIAQHLAGEEAAAWRWPLPTSSGHLTSPPSGPTGNEAERWFSEALAAARDDPCG